MLNLVVLAAGEGKRMKSAFLPKVLHKVCGKTMLDCVISACSSIITSNTIVVVGHMSDKIINSLNSYVKIAYQEKQLGTGHAVMQSVEFLKDDSITLVISGDTPLITSETLSSAFKYHTKNSNCATVLTSKLDNPFGYGRIIHKDNKISIVEQKDLCQHGFLDENISNLSEINSGIYFFDSSYLKKYLKELKSDNAQNEYYLTDIIKLISDSGSNVGAFEIENTDEIIGVNDKLALHQVNQIMQKRINERHMVNGVNFINSGTTYIDHDVEIAIDTTIYPNTTISKKTVIGSCCEIGPDCKISNSLIGSGTLIQNSVILDSTVGENCNIGPFSYIRPNTNIKNHVKIGGFVETKNATIDNGTKIPHLSYVGDIDIGKNVNIACGVVVANYDGIKKHRSKVEDEVFVGCNTNLISPVYIGNKAYIAAGSTITDDVPTNSLAIARNKQINKIDWRGKQ